VGLIDQGVHWLSRSFKGAPTWARVLLIVVAPVVLFVAAGIGLIYELLQRVAPARLRGRVGWISATLAFVVLLALIGAIGGTTQPEAVLDQGSSAPGSQVALNPGNSTLPSTSSIPDPGASEAPSVGLETADDGPGPTIKPVSVTPPRRSCVPTDQDRYVYNPARLQVVTACLQVTGTVAAIRMEADGDLHILIRLDRAYAHLLRPANQGEELGDLVVEPVCVRSVSQADAVSTCAADGDSIASVPASVGDHIWLQGRYVFDLQHGGWAELHPLYRWGAYGTAPPAGPTPRPTPRPTSGSSALAVRITSLTSPVSRGAFATLVARTRAGASCTIVVEYKSGPSHAAGLGPESASSSGSVSWAWKIGSRTTVGSWPVTVSCSSGGRTASARTTLAVR
jgi:hypothetical protein